MHTYHMLLLLDHVTGLKKTVWPSVNNVTSVQSKEMTGQTSDSSSSSNLYFARVIPSIQTVLLSIGALEFKNLQYTFKNLLQPIYKMQGTFTNI